MIKVFDLLSSSESKETRRMIYEEYCRLKKEGKPIIFDKTTAIKNEYDKLKSSFNFVSELIIDGSLDEELFFKIYGGKVIRVWEALEQNILKDRISNPKSCENFRILKERFMKRYSTENLPHIYCTEEKKNELSIP